MGCTHSTGRPIYALKDDVRILLCRRSDAVVAPKLSLPVDVRFLVKVRFPVNVNL